MSVPILATLHPADLMRDPRMTLPTKSDWRRVRAFLDGQWPLPTPDRIIVDQDHPHRFMDAIEWMNHVEGIVSCDTEYVRESGQLLLIGWAGRDAEGHTGGVQVWWPRLPWYVKRAITDALRPMTQRCTVVFQNLIADLPIIRQNIGLEYDERGSLEDLMLAHAALWSEMPHDLGFIASLYSPYPKQKHLAREDLVTYHWGDCIDTLASWDAIAEELRRDPATESIYREQSLPITRRVLLGAKGRGIRVNAERVQSARLDYATKIQQAEWLAQAWLGFPLNLGSNKQLVQYLYEWSGLPVQKHKETKKPTINADAITALRTHLGPTPDAEAEERDGLSLDDAVLRIVEGADPVLEARVIYAAALQADSHYIEPAVKALGDGDGRFYPEFLLHAQASGRWSTNNPPLAQLPHDLRDIICPDTGTVWLGWDWDQIELRLLAALSGDRPLLDAFRLGWDIHTVNCCDIFGYPYPPDRRDPHKAASCAEWRQTLRWEGKDDVRRRFAKVFVYRLNYGGNARLAGDIPGAKTIGLNPTKLVQASQRYLAAHPQLATWRMRAAAEARTTKECRTFLGRRRRLLGDGNTAVREAYNHPLQGGVADIFNLTVVAITEQLPWVEWVYGMHDAQTWACSTEREEETMPLLRQIVERTWNVNGVDVIFPATFKRRTS